MALIVLVDRATLARVDLKIACEHELKHYRPVAVAIVQNSKGEILLLKSSNGDYYWRYPQGGIRERERILNGLLRELGEETGIRSSNLTVRSLCYTDRLELSEPRDGFTRGKSYYYFHVQCRGVAEVILQRSEVSDYRWPPPLRAADIISSLGAEHREESQSMLFALIGALRKKAPMNP